MKKQNKEHEQVEKVKICDHKGCDKEAKCFFMDGYMDTFHLCREHFMEKAKEWGMPSAQ